MLGVTQKTRCAIGKGFGDLVHVVLEKAATERTVEVPAELQSLLDANPAALASFGSMSYSARKDHAGWVAMAAKQETRSSKALKALCMISGQAP